MAIHTRGTEAYDLSLFEPKEDKVIAFKPNKKLQKAQLRQNKIQAFLNTAVTLLVAVVAVTVIGTMITTRVQLTELNSAINQRKTQLTELESEYKQLRAEMAAKTSAQSVDAYAAEQGMQKVEPGQIEYITVDGGDKVQLPGEGEQSWWESVSSAIANFFSDLAYLFH